MASCVFAMHLSGSHLCGNLLGIRALLFGPLKPSLLQAKQVQFPQHLLVGQVFQSPDHLGGPPVYWWCSCNGGAQKWLLPEYKE